MSLYFLSAVLCCVDLIACGCLSFVFGLCCFAWVWWGFVFALPFCFDGWWLGVLRIWFGWFD